MASWIGICGISIAAICVLYAAYYWKREEIGDDSELTYLEELAHEHEQGIADHRKKLQWLIHMIENNYTPSVTLAARLDRMRRILADTKQTKIR